MLAFPGFFRGMLDAGAHQITDALLIAAATAIADTVEPGELNANYIVPSVFDPAVARGGRGGRARGVRAALTCWSRGSDHAQVLRTAAGGIRRCWPDQARNAA